ncbi:hypothetical protein FRC17_009988 [Serendipita sp. 399]|nr:hypothetical protein FRC17_009988 [Serendipita sp. 399]
MEVLQMVTDLSVAPEDAPNHSPSEELSCVVDWNESQSPGSEDYSTQKAISELISLELEKLGAIPLSRYAAEDNPQESSALPTISKKTQESDVELGDNSRETPLQASTTIIETCMRVLESNDAATFEYKEDRGPNSLECILTITRPNGRKRSYTSGPCFSKRSDAKERAAAVALEMGAMEFIKYGDIDAKSRSLLNIGPTQGPSKLKGYEEGKGVSLSDTLDVEVDDSNIKAISDCCLEWRAGVVKPVYLYFSEPTFVPRSELQGKKAKTPIQEDLTGLKQGCALSITLSQHTTRVYSVHHIYSTRGEAKSAVAAVAIKQGVIDFIRHGNGQKSAMVFIRELDGDANENLNMEVISRQIPQEKEISIEATSVNFTLKKHQIPLDAMTLQAFTNSLPKPFPETDGLKPLGDSNPVGWLNTAVQAARGSRMTITWTYLSNAKLSLHGCLVRFNLPRLEDGRSYLVEPQFIRRADAKAAVALLAISQDVGGWIAGITKAIEDQITPEMRAKSGSILLSLSQECIKAKLQNQPTYEYVYDDGAVGCILKMELSPFLKREYRVSTEYRTKADARFAVLLKAHHGGLFEFIRFRGEVPPRGYNPEELPNWRSAHRETSTVAKRDDPTPLRRNIREQHWNPRHRHEIKWEGGNGASSRAQHEYKPTTGRTSVQQSASGREFMDSGDQRTRSVSTPTDAHPSVGRRFLRRPWDEWPDRGQDYRRVSSDARMRRGGGNEPLQSVTQSDQYRDSWRSGIGPEQRVDFLYENDLGPFHPTYTRYGPYSTPLPPPLPPLAPERPQEWQNAYHKELSVVQAHDGTYAVNDAHNQPNLTITSDWQRRPTKEWEDQQTEDGRGLDGRSQRQFATWDLRYGEHNMHKSPSTSTYEVGRSQNRIGAMTTDRRHHAQEGLDPQVISPAGRSTTSDRGQPALEFIEDNDRRGDRERKRDLEDEGRTNNKRPKQSVQSVQRLYDYCSRNGMPTPVFRHEKTSMGEFRVIVSVGKERYSLRQTFTDEETGKEEVCRKILGRFSKQTT